MVNIYTSSSIRMNSELCMFCLFMFIPTGAKQGEGVENCAVCFVEVLLYNLCMQFSAHFNTTFNYIVETR